jgi:galactose-1-phosphate uridylyltransferase
MFLSYSYCQKCEKETKHFNDKCSICSEKERAANEESWKALSLENKVEVLRKQIESIDIMRRIQ